MSVCVWRVAWRWQGAQSLSGRMQAAAADSLPEGLRGVRTAARLPGQVAVKEEDVMWG